ncbi:MAG: PQQ-binding-like beta-propeller repeat protein [Verrucomicrobiota bacterium]
MESRAHHFAWPAFGSALVATAAVVAALLAGSAPASSQTSWPMGGQNYANTRYNGDESRLSASNVSQLAPRWTFTTHGDVSATPAVVGNAVYFPDWGGYFYKVDASTGDAIWSHQVSEYDGISGAVSRTSPAVAGDTVYIGDQNGAHLLAVDTSTGTVRWSTQLDSHPNAILTQSPVVYKGVVFEGVASSEESAAADPSYACCTFRGSLVAVNAATGQILWKTYTVPSNGESPGGYSGGAVWGSTPALDPAQNTVYVTTGNNYTVPQAAKDCQSAGGSATSCLSPDNHDDSVLALDMKTGQIKWATRLQQGFDDWNGGCLTPANTNCPIDPGPGYDFAAGPNLLKIKSANGKPRPVIGAGQKSGTYSLLDALTGQVLWTTAAGPPSRLGGIMWGTATDGKRIYIAEANASHSSFVLNNGQTITSGFFAALDAGTGAVLWQTPDPSGDIDLGALSAANGVVYAPSMSGHMYALSTATGTVLWDHLGAGSSNAGAAIVNGTVYWGNGYSRLGVGTGSATFYAFSRGGR